MHPTFLLGCQRSGTTALLDTLALSPGLRAYHEGDAAVMQDYRLLPVEHVQRVLASGEGPALLKPICDAHYADLILNSFPRARALWLYRQPRDVAGSMIRKWPGHMRDVMARAHARDLDWLGWRTERLSAEHWRTIDALWHPELRDADAAALFWWLRNQWVCALDLPRHSCVMMVRYEDLVRAPHALLPQICAFVRTPYTPEMADNLRTEHVGKDHELELVAPIARLCNDLLARLDEAMLKGVAC